jgi:FixJ family two-component response regulator
VSTGNLFVVDDDESVLESVKAVLNRFGYEPKCYTSGEQFLSSATLEAAGCLITDLQMPGIDGVRLQQHLNEIHSPLSVIVLSGTADVPTVVNVMRKGAYTLLEKPHSSKELVASVQSALDASSQYYQKQQLVKRVKGLLASLTDEERTVLKQMLAGVPNKNMATVMDIGMRTVDRRRQAVFTKMEVSTIAELATLLNSASIDLETLEESE